jgi:hypothetical protein
MTNWEDSVFCLPTPFSRLSHKLWCPYKRWPISPRAGISREHFFTMTQHFVTLFLCPPTSAQLRNRRGVLSNAGVICLGYTSFGSKVNGRKIRNIGEMRLRVETQSPRRKSSPTLTLSTTNPTQNNMDLWWKRGTRSDVSRVTLQRSIILSTHEPCHNDTCL